MTLESIIVMGIVTIVGTIGGAIAGAQPAQSLSDCRCAARSCLHESEWDGHGRRSSIGAITAAIRSAIVITVGGLYSEGMERIADARGRRAVFEGENAQVQGKGRG